MIKCDYCQHVEMCGWRKSLEERGCDFFDDGNKWIPCSERLPEMGSTVLMQNTGGWMFVATYAVTPKRKYWAVLEHDYALDEAIAWMPLPEPYKGETKIVNCTNTKCDNCVNHNYCDYEPYKAETKNEAVELIEKRENVCKTLQGKSAYRALKYIVECIDKPVTCKDCKYSEPCILDKSTFSCSHI